MSEAIDRGRHRAPRKVTAPWRWLVAKVGKVGAIVAVVMVALALTAAAAIFLRAYLSGSAQTGAAVAFEWSTDGTTPTDGVLQTRWGVDQDSDGDIDDLSTTFPSGLGCTAQIVSGELQVALTGDYLPGESCLVASPFLLNPSAVDISIIDWDFSTSDLGLIDSGAPVEVSVKSGVSPATQGVDAGLPADVLSGQGVKPGTFLLFQIAPEAPFSTVFDFAGSSVVGQTTR